MIKTFLSLPVLLRVYLGITAVMSIIALLTFGIDKLLSKAGISLGPLRFTFRRVPERTLLTLSMLGGSFGAMIGMLLFRQDPQGQIQDTDTDTRYHLGAYRACRHRLRP